MGWGSAEVWGRQKQQMTTTSVYVCVCIDMRLHVCSCPTSLRPFQSLPTGMDPPGFVCPSHSVILLWHQLCALYPFHAFASAVWVVHTHTHVHTNTHCFVWLTFFWIQVMLLFPEVFLDLHQWAGHINPWALPYCGFDSCLIIVCLLVGSALDWEPLEEGGALCFVFLTTFLASIFLVLNNQLMLFIYLSVACLLTKTSASWE